MRKQYITLAPESHLQALQFMCSLMFQDCLLSLLCSFHPTESILHEFLLSLRNFKAFLLSCPSFQKLTNNSNKEIEGQKECIANLKETIS